jgi:hypothetical protein
VNVARTIARDRSNGPSGRKQKLARSRRAAGSDRRKQLGLARSASHSDPKPSRRQSPWLPASPPSPNPSSRLSRTGSLPIRA